MYRQDGSLSIFGVWLIGGITIFIIVFAWSITAGPLTSIVDTFTGLDTAVSETHILGDALKNTMGYVLIIGVPGTLAWMIFSSFKKERQEYPI